MKHLVQHNIQLLQQLSEVVVQLKEFEYKSSLDIYFGASIGQHTRHILSFFDCLLKGYDSGELCFDKRVRDKAIEQNSEAAKDEINRIIKRISNIEEDKKIVFLSIMNGSKSTTSTTVIRELLYTIEHSVHHLAMIRMGVHHNFPHIKLPANFGVAQSTIAYQEKKCAQ